MGAWVVASGVLAAASGCAGEPSPGPLGSSTLTVTRTFTLEESDSVVSMAPRLSFTDDGQLLVVEPTSGNVRIHDREGGLVKVLGRPGEGPGEFAFPLEAAASGSRVWVLDLIRGVSEWELATGMIVRQHPPPHGFNLSLLPLGDSLLAVGGVTPREAPWRLLALLDAETGEVRERHFEHVVDPSQVGLALTVGSVPLTLDGEGRIHGMHAWSDTLRVLGADGTMSQGIPLPIPGFSRQGTLPDPETLGALRVVRRVAVVPEGVLLVQYAIPTPTQADERFGLLLLEPDGTLLHHQESVPRLLAVEWPELFFGDSTGLAPARIIVMEYREEP